MLDYVTSIAKMVIKPLKYCKNVNNVIQAIKIFASIINY